MKSLELPHREPDKIHINVSVQISGQNTGCLCRGRLSIALIPNQGYSPVEAVRLVSVHVVNQSLVIQFAYDQILGSRSRQSGSAIHRVVTFKSMERGMTVLLQPVYALSQ
jgi:hypothetical protein